MREHHEWCDLECMNSCLDISNRKTFCNFEFVRIQEKTPFLLISSSTDYAHDLRCIFVIFEYQCRMYLCLSGPISSILHVERILYLRFFLPFHFKYACPCHYMLTMIMWYSMLSEMRMCLDDICDKASLPTQKCA